MPIWQRKINVRQRLCVPRLSKHPASNKCTIVCGVRGQEFSQDQSLIVLVLVSSYEKAEKKKLWYALNDCQSNATFISERMSRALGVQGVESQLLLSTMYEGGEVVDCCKIMGLNVMEVKREVSITLPQTFTRDTIPFKGSDSQTWGSHVLESFEAYCK